ncbi:MAG: DUF4926 domain-containing protein [Chloroflexi bacterium]|nr:DUF4926 domain-containing protein [Chloroflexota bacterium]
MPYPNYSRVKLLSDTYHQNGLEVGAIGYIIEVHGNDFYEVEFSNLEGTTIVLLVLSETDIELSDIKNDDALS